MADSKPYITAITLPSCSGDILLIVFITFSF
jgi:hypothetical protein